MGDIAPTHPPAGSSVIAREQVDPSRLVMRTAVYRGGMPADCVEQLSNAAITIALLAPSPGVLGPAQGQRRRTDVGHS
jgi:hypothetical protein